MRQFLRDILWVILFGILILLPLEIFSSQKQQTTHPLALQYQFMEQHPDSVSTLILGHSQTAAGINPRLISDSVFNMSYSGRIIYFDRLILSKYIDRMDNLKTVIYPMHYSFNGAMRFFEGGEGMSTSLYEYRHYMHIFPWRYPLRGIRSYSQFLSGMFAISQLETGRFGNKKSENIYGYAPLEGHTDWRNEYDLIQIKQEEFTDDLTEMARLCATRGIRFIVIVCPFTDEAIAKVSPEGMNNMQHVIDTVRRHYPVEYHNYLSNEQFIHDTMLFYDWSHLNNKGAEVFSHRIKQDLGL